MSLCIPYVSVYMLALGLKDSQIGFITSLYMLSQMVWAFLGGPITDRLGRRRATAIFDFTAWCIPALLWWRAESFWFFFVAALFNGAMQIAVNSWNCLWVEDADKNEITGINSLVITAGQLSALFAPITAILISRMTLVPAIRILYINAIVVMTAKVLLCYAFSRETKMGIIRMEETRGKNIFLLAAGYTGVLKIIRGSRGTVFALVITALAGIVVMINTTFWQIIVSRQILVPDHFLPLFPIIRSAVAIFFLFFVVPRLTKENLKIPLLAGFASYFAGQLILILIQAENPVKYLLLSSSLLFDGFGLGTLSMLSRSLAALHVDPEERARVMAILNMAVMAITSPFGWIAGMLSNISRSLPFVLNLVLLITGIVFTIIFYRKSPQAPPGG